MNRKHISLKTKLAAALRQVLGIRREDAKRMSEDDVIASVEWHHIVPLGLEINDEHFNLEALRIADHREQTRKDITAIAKTKRLERDWRNNEKWLAFLSGASSEASKRRLNRQSRWPKRRFAKRAK